jgi:hypothetical protein
MADVSASGILVLLAMLQIKHAICDGPLQTLRMVQEKGIYGRPWGLVHSGLHGLGRLIVFLIFGLGFLPALLLSVAEMVVHYQIDFVKESLVRRHHWKQDNAFFWWALMGDQLLHHLTYIALGFAVINL